MDLSSNLLSLIPDGFLSHCNKLESLNLNDNQLGEQTTALKLIILFSVFNCCLTENETLASEMLPSESESAKLEHLSSMYLNNNQLTGREPFYVPKFLLELPRYQYIYMYLSWFYQCSFYFITILLLYLLILFYIVQCFLF